MYESIVQEVSTLSSANTDTADYQDSPVNCDQDLRYDLYA